MSRFETIFTLIRFKKHNYYIIDQICLFVRETYLNAVFYVIFSDFFSESPILCVFFDVLTHQGGGGCSVTVGYMHSYSGMVLLFKNGRHSRCVTA